jgi:predicted MFS family arabinose efflux permease
MTATDSADPQTPTTWVFLALAAATGFSVATIYLNQTILSPLAHYFGRSASQIGLISTATQLGYALGVFFLVPVGDIISKKKLSLFKLVFLFFGLLILGSARSLAGLYIGSAIVGILASVAQDFVPLAADLANPHERGRVVGVVMSGLFIGILASRTVSGLIETAFGWRWVFWGFSVFILLFIFFIAWAIPPVEPRRSLSYGKLIQSVGRFFWNEPDLRRSLRTHGLIGFTFSAFWTNLSFHLSRPPFGLTSFHVGLFGLAGAAGALVAPIAGRLSDARGPRFGIKMGISAVVASFLLMFALPHSLLVLIIGAVVFDGGAQMSLISHQTIIYALDENARSSLNAVFVTGLFLSFAVGSAVSTQVQALYGWRAVMGLSLCSATLALISAHFAAKPILKT